jgi:hypothetical protein
LRAASSSSTFAKSTPIARYSRHRDHDNLFPCDKRRPCQPRKEARAGVADAKILDKNYADQQADIWSSEGKMLATCYQACHFKE